MTVWIAVRATTVTVAAVLGSVAGVGLGSHSGGIDEPTALIVGSAGTTDISTGDPETGSDPAEESDSAGENDSAGAPENDPAEEAPPPPPLPPLPLPPPSPSDFAKAGGHPRHNDSARSGTPNDGQKKSAGYMEIGS